MSTKAVTVGYGQYRFTLTNVSEADDNADVACMCGEYTVGNDRAILTVISKILKMTRMTCSVTRIYLNTQNISPNMNLTPVANY